MKLLHCIRHSFFLFGLVSLLWLLFRTGTKPSRAAYPCQQASAAVGSMWLTIYILPLPSMIRPQKIWNSRRGRIVTEAMALVVCIMLALSLLSAVNGDRPASKTVTLSFSESRAQTPQASNIFVVNGTKGDYGGIQALIDLMDSQGIPFYKNKKDKNKGLIANDDIILIKVNCQWDERGGTNTDLVKALILAILNHPSGFQGEIVIADNGQGQYGSTGLGGSLSYSKNNAQDISQSMQRVADSFPDYKISTYLWDNITTKRVKEFVEGDDQDGYVVDNAPNSHTGIVVSYPKFTTRYGTKVSFKMGIWDARNQDYDSRKLKVINAPVLKSHGIYGVTASIKHYMGVVSDKLTSQLGGRAHYTIAEGGMGTEMAETRFPALNLVDAVWVNAHPRGGPSTSYDKATQTNVIAVSTDPVAVDCWAAKQILMPAAERLGYNDLSSMDPDNAAQGSFGYWLRLSMDELRRAGYQVTMNEKSMNVYLAQVGS